jgi:arsenate reductase
LRKDGAGRFAAFSAGSLPTGAVNPFALRTLESLGYPIVGLRSTNWVEFAGPHVPAIDFVFTLCDSAAREACPVWPGKPVSAHWGVHDPAKVSDNAEKEASFLSAARHIKARVDAFLALPLDELDDAALKSELRKIGRMEGATASAAAAG